MGKMQIFVRLTIRTAREAPIQNRQFDPIGTSNVSLEYVNPRRGDHTESSCHGDRKLCSTRRENSSPVKELGITYHPGIGIAYVTTIQNRHSETVDRTLNSWNSMLGPKFHRGACVLVH
ncbi:hypothetical protein Taro_000864 [Colocasia esculenta]|uniref:Uncharacterized protein n=1 Tax=Colocasia esculenta TaxID=4460 RepID=A0A843TE75_COLES|nr:hypothetical protein [Colocasia esculenta]